MPAVGRPWPSDDNDDGDDDDEEDDGDDVIDSISQTYWGSKTQFVI